ncbi:MAG TPA: hypothetical protein VEO01_37610 [Pseudonocardiaceae bacterium]|nr:hypothetical protein [Pseudonocardiaceae bacterium]
MGDGNGFGIGDLSGTADAVGGGVDHLGGMSAPDLPDAGVSSASVAGVLSAMSSVISNVVRTAATARCQVAANQQSYQDTDRAWRSAFTADDGGTR